MRNAIQPLEPRRLLSTVVVIHASPPSPGSPGSNGYAPGDWNYDGVLNAADFGFYNGMGGVQSSFSGTAKNDVIVLSAADKGGVNVTVNNNITIQTFAGKLEIFANNGNDNVHIKLPDSYAHWLITIHGGGGHDVIVGSAAAERVMAGDGDDTVCGNDGRDTIYGEGGNDSVRGGGSSDFMDGGAGDDTLRGDAGNDRINGGDGFDRLRGSLGNDSLAGGASKDFIGGEDGDDELQGDGGADVLAGGDGNDLLRGDAGDDHLEGNAGDDLLDGSSGSNVLFGGAGNDRSRNAMYTDNDPLDTDDDHGTAFAREFFLVGTGVNIVGGVQGLVQQAPNSSASGGSFAGQTITGSTPLVMYTYAGDETVIDLSDLIDYGPP